MIRDNGADAILQRRSGEAMVKAVQESGGILTMEDLAGYDIKLRTPVSGTYRGYEILSSPPPSSRRNNNRGDFKHFSRTLM